MVLTFSKAADGNTNISPNFMISEFACNDGTDSILLDDNLPKVLQRIRVVIGNKPISVSSGYRTPAYNLKIDGATNSYHTKGMAADIIIDGISTTDICKAAETALSELKIPGGICLYIKQSFVHVDTRDVKWRGQDDGDGSGAKNVSGWPLIPPPVIDSSSTLSDSSSSDAIIWSFFKDRGLNDFATAGLMGNLFAESGLKSNILQHPFKTKLNHTDESYTTSVDNGSYTNFVKDEAGYGLAQWTFWSRKQALFNYAKSVSKSIGDIYMQLNFLWQELQSYQAVISVLKSATSIRQASDIVLIKFEQPEDQGISMQERRAGYGQNQYNKFSGQGNEPIPIEKSSYNVRSTEINLSIRTGPGVNYPISGKLTDNGVYTIIEDANGAGASKWGKVYDGQNGAQSGWISLDYTENS